MGVYPYTPFLFINNKMKHMHEDCKVYEKIKGPTAIKNLNIGDWVLVKLDNVDTFSEITSIEESYNNEPKNLIVFNNGSELRIQCNIKDNLLFNRPINVDIVDNEPSNEASDIGWMIGMHMGDGTCDRKLYSTIKGDYFKYRVRINGDNEEIIRKYGIIFNSISNSNIKYSIDGRTAYKVDVWQYTISNKNVENVVNYYFDGKFGDKTYCGITPSYINRNNTWISYIAGLIDSDGHVKDGGSIDIAMCMSSVIDDICIYLSSIASDYKYSRKTSIRANEQPINRLVVYRRSKIIQKLLNHITHQKKHLLISKGNPNKYYSPVKFDISDEMYNRLMCKKLPISTTDDRYLNTRAVQSLMRKSKGKIGLASLALFLDLNLISQLEYNTIISKLCIVNINQLEDLHRYINIRTAEGSIYVGNYGLVAVEPNKMLQ